MPVTVVFVPATVVGAGGGGFEQEARRRRSASKNGFDDRATGSPAERLVAGGHFIEQETQGKNIGAAVEVIAANVLGRHIGRCAADNADDGEGILS